MITLIGLPSSLSQSLPEPVSARGSSSVVHLAAAAPCGDGYSQRTTSVRFSKVNPTLAGPQPATMTVDGTAIARHRRAHLTAPCAKLTAARLPGTARFMALILCNSPEALALRRGQGLDFAEHILYRAGCCLGRIAARLYCFPNRRPQIVSSLSRLCQHQLGA